MNLSMVIIIDYVNINKIIYIVVCFVSFEREERKRGSERKI